MKNITFAADEQLIEAAREQAAADGSTLNEQFRLWLAHYAAMRRAAKAIEVVQRVSAYARSGIRRRVEQRWDRDVAEGGGLGSRIEGDPVSCEELWRCGRGVEGGERVGRGPAHPGGRVDEVPLRQCGQLCVAGSPEGLERALANQWIRRPEIASEKSCLRGDDARPALLWWTEV